MDFDTIIAQGEAALEKFVAEGEQETLNLEFKSEAANGRGNAWLKGGVLTDTARKVMGKALSGMANSAGGILVLGVEAREGPDRIDAAIGLIPFANLRLLHSRVIEAVGTLLQPRHDSIRVAPIPSVADPTSGYLVVEIPRSDRRPHRCEAKDQKQYFKRAAGSTFAMEHYDIEDAFKRVSWAELGLTVSVSGGRSLGHDLGRQHTVHFDFWLTNAGDASARYASLLLLDVEPIHLQRREYGQNLQNVSREGGQIRFSAGSDFVVHPGETRRFDQLAIEVVLTDQGQILYVNNGQPVGDIALPYRLFADNTKARSGELLVSAETLGTAL